LIFQFEPSKHFDKTENQAMVFQEKKKKNNTALKRQSHKEKYKGKKLKDIKSLILCMI